MMLQRTTTNQSDQAAIARLTAKERECLDRWLRHLTAKEIALELGISHHAVEKRLKSARAKLGVSSTLEAARLVAAAPGYGQTASQSPEVVAAPSAAQQEGVAAPVPFRMPRRGTILTGVIIMSLLLLAALGLTAPSQPAPTGKVVVVNGNDHKATDLASALGGVFARLDKDRDGFIAGEELTAGRLLVTRTGASNGEAVPGARATGLADFDSSGDGRVSEAEFRNAMAALAKPRR